MPCHALALAGLKRARCARTKRLSESRGEDRQPLRRRQHHGHPDTRACDGYPARLGQQFIVENKPGAGGALGTASVARGDADGYTLLFAPALVLSVYPQARKDAGYETELDSAGLPDLHQRDGAGGCA